MTDSERTIEHVLIDYATGIDTKNWQLFRGCFTDSCVMTTAAGSIQGAAALTAHMERLHDPLDSSAHRLSNVAVSVKGDEATARSYLDALLVQQGHPNGPVFRVYGTYDDVLVRADRGWLIQERTFAAIWREGNAAVLATPTRRP